jgi:hypothetical protein
MDSSLNSELFHVTFVVDEVASEQVFIAVSSAFPANFHSTTPIRLQPSTKRKYTAQIFHLQYLNIRACSLSVFVFDSSPNSYGSVEGNYNDSA